MKKNNVGTTSLLFILLACCFVNMTRTEVFAGEYATRSGKSLLVVESHPYGQSLSDIQLVSSGFEHELAEEIKDSDPIQAVHVADLDGNGFEEFYIVTISSGSGSYGNIVAFASNKDKSLSAIYFPEIQEGDDRFEGYMGHDRFHLTADKLIRSFPVYLPADKNATPSGGTRKVTYGLFKGEASWQLRIIDSEDAG